MNLWINFPGKWLGSRQIRCNWATKGAGGNEDKQSSDAKSVVELTNGSSGESDTQSENQWWITIILFHTWQAFITLFSAALPQVFCKENLFLRVYTFFSWALGDYIDFFIILLVLVEYMVEEQILVYISSKLSILLWLLG